jgi:CelD/BcsL family acetyltransferase involved in cellulose biosynthesis
LANATPEVVAKEEAKKKLRKERRAQEQRLEAEGTLSEAQAEKVRRSSVV